MQNEVLQKIKIEAEKICTQLNLQLYNVEFNYSSEMKTNILHVEIDNHFQITMEEIEKFSDLFNSYLDTLDSVIIEDYSLDVSSPGIERKIEISDLIYLKDRYIKFDYKDETGKIKESHLEGQIIEIETDTLKLKVNNKGRIKEYILNIANMSNIETYIK